VLTSSGSGHRDLDLPSPTWRLTRVFDRNGPGAGAAPRPGAARQTPTTTPPAPTSTTDWRAKVSTPAYLPSGALAARLLGSGIAGTELAWHPDGMAESLTWRNGADQVLRSHSAIAYDRGAQRIAEEVSSRQVDGPTTSGQASYGCDLVERLVSWTSSFLEAGLGEALSLDYTLDDAANITAATTTGATADLSWPSSPPPTLTAAWPRRPLPQQGPPPPSRLPTTAWARRSCARETTSTWPAATTPWRHTATVDDRTPTDDNVSTTHDGEGGLLSRTEPGAGPERFRDHPIGGADTTCLLSTSVELVRPVECRIVVYPWFSHICQIKW
jgi:hypothetical protein